MDMDVYGGGSETMRVLKDRAVSGIKWSAVSQTGRQGTQLITTVILAHLLSPSDFGLAGMAMVVIGFVNIFKDLGTAAAVIQRKELSDTLLSTVFWVNVSFGLLATFLLFLAAPLGAYFYREPRVVAVLQILSISFFISCLGILHQALLERTLSFNTLAKLETVSVLVGSLVGIGLAFARAGVWSLVFQSLITVSVNTFLLWLSSPWRPHWGFRWSEVKTISAFSLNLTGFSIFNYFARNADYLLIGRYLGAQDLGYYTLAYRILLFPLQNITAVVGRVMYPVLSTMQEDNQRFNSAYLKVNGAIAFITFPLMAGLLAVAEPFVLTFFGEKWQPLVLLIMIFAPVGMIQSIGATVGGIYQVKGRTDWMFRWGVGSGTLVVMAFLIGLRWGIIGVAAAYAIVSFILSYPGFSIPFRLVDLRFAELLKVLRPSFMNSSLMFIGLLVFRKILPLSLSHVSILIMSVTLGVTVYAVATWVTNRKQAEELWSLTGLKRTKAYESP
jgi:O-antigen/teichoic acid export membrane protein